MVLKTNNDISSLREKKIIQMEKDVEALRDEFLQQQKDEICNVSLSLVEKIVKKEMADEKVRKQFLDDLSRMDPEPIIDELKDAAGDRDIYLLCYEKPSDFCHRHIVAEWLKQNNIECEEKVW